jgi:hypothetical protein
MTEDTIKPDWTGLGFNLNIVPGEWDGLAKCSRTDAAVTLLQWTVGGSNSGRISRTSQDGIDTDGYGTGRSLSKSTSTPEDGMA